MQKNKILSIILIVIAAIFFLYKHYNQTDRPSPSIVENTNNQASKNIDSTNSSNDISALTNENKVVPYVKQKHHLPDYYITKNEARKQGWIAAKGNLCDVLPGRAIGGDRFSNREHSLPDDQGRKWFEADINFDCGRRNADRLLYSSDGLVYITKDHYKTFEQK